MSHEAWLLRCLEPEHSKSMIKAALFTCFHPDTGGGAVNLRSVLEAIEDIEVTWYYLGTPGAAWDRSVCLGNTVLGGRLSTDAVASLGLWIGPCPRAIEEMAEKILAAKFDVHWVVAMNEGVGVGNYLRRKAPDIPLHVSVQDDQAGWMWARSRRYKWIAWSVRWRWNQLLRLARSVDVTSDGMSQHYRETVGVESHVIHPYVRKLPVLEPMSRTYGRISVGHIGSVYDQHDFAVFLRAMRVWTWEKTLKFDLVMIGYSGLVPWMRRHAQADGEEIISNLAEGAAVGRLARCDFLYAMYPFKAAAKLFRQTSLPTKLSTYVQVQRPIFAHTPLDSSLARLVRDQRLGVVAPSQNENSLRDYLDKMATFNFTPEACEKARQEVYGEANIEKLRACLRS